MYSGIASIADSITGQRYRMVSTLGWWRHITYASLITICLATSDARAHEQ